MLAVLMMNVDGSECDLMFHGEVVRGVNGGF